MALSLTGIDLKICSKIIFNSEWSKKRFLTGIDPCFKKLLVVRQSADRQKIDLKNKKNIITFVGKLNKAKGYDVFGNAIIDILNKHKKWNAVVIGDEERESHFFKHKNLNLLGFQNHKYVLNIFKKASISVVCSRWEEPFGRTSLEAAANGCACNNIR